MSIKYRLIERVDPRDLTLPRKFYAQIKYGDEVKFNDLVDLISQFSTVNYGDIHGVIQTLLQVIPHQLKYGRQIHLGDLGTFYLTIKSEGKDSEEDFFNTDIKNARIRFRPGASFKKMLKTVDFRKAESSSEQAGPPGN